jgi:hypothetical protein
LRRVPVDVAEAGFFRAAGIAAAGVPTARDQGAKRPGTALPEQTPVPSWRGNLSGDFHDDGA